MKTFGQKKVVKKMKFISDQEGIMNRYLREKENWTPHLENTKQFILESFKDESIKTITVLGSGWLLDLPIKKLSERFKKVLLVDVYHPPQIRKKTESFKNVSLFETDLTGGGIEFCWELRKLTGDQYSNYFLDEFRPKRPELPFKTDAFVSLNLLNQLDILLVDFLNKKNKRITDMEILNFRKSIQQFHLDWITKKPGCLIVDTEEVNISKEQTSESEKLVHVALPKPKREENWAWDFDLSGKYREGKETRMNVKAIEWV